MATLPTIAITLGDVAGIGPEVVARACADERVRGWCRPVIVGHPDVLRRAAGLVGAGLTIREIPDLDALRTFAHQPATIACWNPAGEGVRDVAPGSLDARAGQAAYESLVAATQAALAGRVVALVTAPISKAALHAAGHHYPGHTEILAELCGTPRYAMMLYLPADPGLAVAHVTLHTSIASVPRLLSIGGIIEKIELTADFLRRIGCAAPRLGVCALNPHAGEDGLFGDEEQRLIRPAVESAAKAAGPTASVQGPIPADTLFRRAIDGEFDGVVAMYHDQGHIALKLVGLGRAVNVTLGLPIVRTSPSHGTAFDIAWQGRARPEGMVDAIAVAVRLAGVSGEW
jgi:4-hydroxythreonine-4-phosphate dehydrogenase